MTTRQFLARYDWHPASPAINDDRLDWLVIGAAVVEVIGAVLLVLVF